MLGIVVAITLVALIALLSMSAVYHVPIQKDREEIESNRILFKNKDEKQKIEYLLEQKSKIDQKQLSPQVKQEVSKPVAPVAPQINNYDFEKLSKALTFIVGGVFSIISLKLFIRFFNYYRTTRKFKKNTKKTQLLVEQLKTVFDNEKDFLLITDSVEHQLKMNDLLLKLDDSKHYGLELEIADDYLYESYNFINEKLIGNLK